MKKLMSKGFTLIELLVVIGILAILLAITLIAINPARQFNQANDTKRNSEVSTVLNAVGQYFADNKGLLPAGIPTGVATDALPIGYSATAGARADICGDIVPTYISALPVDPAANGGSGNGVALSACPAAGTEYTTGYTIVRSAGSNARVTVCAPSTAIGAPICVTR